MQYNPEIYKITNADALDTPALCYFEALIEENTRRAIAMASDPARLWPHTKSHKMAEMIAMQRGMGIDRFKCATIAEGQLLARCGAGHALLAYPLVGPMITRFLALQTRYPATSFYAIADNLGQAERLSRAALPGKVNLLIDVDMGMHRTGVPLEATEALYRAAAALPGITMQGLHCYDGHRHEDSLTERRAKAEEAIAFVRALRDRLLADGLPCPNLVMGGTPSFPIHAAYPDVYCSPGTVFLSHAGYAATEGLPFTPAAGVLTRVISHPGEGLFTLDMGTKALASEMPGVRGVIVGMEGAERVLQSEEHSVYRVAEGAAVPGIGSMWFVIPMHICPTTMLYPFAHVVREGAAAGKWVVAARDREIGI
ncbi:MAG: D-TA family PLP-dependent enzyme [Oscillospiraceae bacterium]|jgi:D-serine deaminase-like pyridoxal phosphate-dependent protein|nr:D-TA family PLP-dependent enzyme [Oscillospiraceae bacterium]